MRLEISIKITATVNDVADIKMTARRVVVAVEKEDHIEAKSHAAISGVKLRPWSSKNGRQPRQFLAIGNNLLRESLRRSEAPALSFDVVANAGKIARRGGAENKACHL